MASSTPTQLPAYIALRYEENGVFDRLYGAAEDAAARTKRQFERSFKETESVVAGSLNRIGSQMGKLDLGLGDMRQQSADLRLYRDALDEVSRTAAELARETGDTSASTRQYLQALSSQRAEADRALKIADAQVSTYTRLQGALDGAASATGRLAQSQRAAYAEAARAAQEEVSARATQSRYADNYGYDRSATSNGAGYSALAERAALDELRRAELGLVESNRILQATYQNTALAFDHTAKSARDSAQAFIEAERANEALKNEVNQLRLAMDPSLALQQRFDAEMERADRLMSQGAIGAREYGQAQDFARQQLSEGYQALFRSNEAHEGYIVTSRRFNQAVLQSGQQMQDFAIQVYSGQSASVAAAQQLPQLAFALSGLEGHTNKTYDRIGKFATYLSGPWGLAVGLGAGVLGTLVYQMVATGDATDDLVAKLQEEARETERTTRAQEQFGETAEGVKKAIEEQRAALDKQIASLKTEAERNVESAKTNLAREIQIRNTTKALLESLIAQEQYNAAYARSPNAAKEGNLGQGMLELSQRRVQAAEWKLAEQNASIEIAKYNLTVADSFLTVEQASQSAEEAINKRYDGMIERARKAAVASGTVATALGKEVAGYEAARKAELEAIKATSGASASAQANLGDMVALIKDLFPGATITSTTGGKHVKGSDHYAGRALDFVPGGGMGQYTTAEVEQILRDAGVDIRRNAGGVQQLFGPGRSAGKKGDHDDHFHLAWQGSVPDPEKVKAATAKAQELLARFGDQSAEAIARINERFDEQPRLIDQAAQATRQLDAVIADLSQRKPPGFEQMIADAEAAKGTIEDALVRPFRQMADDAQRRLQIQTALAAGQEDEAAALQEIFRLEDQIGDLTNDQKDAVRAVVAEEQRRTRELERQRVLFEAQLDVLDQARSSLTDLLSGRSSDFFGDIRQALQDLNGKRMFDSLFGDMFQQIEDELRGQSPLGKESQRAADELTKFTDAVKGATAGISGAANDNGLVTASATSPEFKQAFDALFSGRTVGWSGGMNAPGAMSAAGESGVIEVTTKRPTDITNRSITEIADKISGAIVNPFEKALSDAFGTEFAQMLGGVMKGALSGYMTGGTTGGILGGLKGIVDQTGIFGGSTGGVSGALGKAGSGAATGTMAAGIMKSLGLKTSTTGAQIGGAIGSFVPIPGGEIIGSIAGGLIGGLFKTNRTANAILTNGSGYTQSGKDSGNYSTAAGLGDSVLEGLNNIVDQLGGEIGNFMVTIGTRGDEYRVNTNGTSLKLKNGAISFGDDAEAAIAYAIKNAIEDGAIKGMRQSTINIIKAGKDLDAALSDAVDWENAFKELKKYKDPIGSALDDLDEEFEKLIEIGKAGSASAEEMAQLEELYGIKRNEIIKEQAETLVGSLKSLLSDLITGDNGLSLRDRRNAALSEYDALAARVQAGDTTAYDDYTDAAQTLLGIERDLYGSQQEYFDRLNEVIDLTKTRIDAETNVVSINENRDSPFDSTGAVKSSIDTVNDSINAQLSAVNQNIGTLINLWGQVVTTGSSSTSASRLTFASSF